jgi:hypothetical protein
MRDPPSMEPGKSGARLDEKAEIEVKSKTT